MSATLHRGEISWIGDSFFINYSLGLPAIDSVSTSGYYMRKFVTDTLEPQQYNYYSYFTVQRGANTSTEQVTELNEIDPKSGLKGKLLATVQWNELQNVALGLITGYAPPEGWEEIVKPPYFSIYLSMASVHEPSPRNESNTHNKPGMGINAETGQLELHMNRIPECHGAILTIYPPEIPAGVTINDLKLYAYQHQVAQSAQPHSEHNASPILTPISATLNPAGNGIEIGALDQTLQMGLYVVAVPVDAPTANSPIPADTPHQHHEENAEATALV